MVVSKSRPIFLKSVDYSNQVKDKNFIINLLKEIIDEVSHENVIKIITNNAKIIRCWYVSSNTLDSLCCVVHILNRALKNIYIYAPKNFDNNREIYIVFKWITKVHGDAL